MGTGICLFLHWENGISVIGTGNHKHKTRNGKHVGNTAYVINVQ